ncbi:MAG: hypothetical protein JWP52_1105 [Rhizobacter sp.]|jgi:hypothetical protein|nr:hypothetical protein [Rhizobacter sp.]
MSGSNSSARGSAPAVTSMPEAVGLTVHSMLPPDVQAERRTRNGRLKMLLVLAVCAAPVIASYFTYFVIRPQGRTNYSDLVTPPRPIARLPLTDLQGRAVIPESLKGQWLMVVVAGGACDTRCENYLFLQRQLRETLGREKERVDKLWLVTDDAPIRPEVSSAISPGQPATVLRVPRARLAEWLSPGAGQALEDHIYIVDPMGNWMMRSPVDPEPKKLRGDVDKLLRASASWDEPGR